MALARNLKPNRIPKLKSKSRGQISYKKISLYGLIFLVSVFGLYGVFNLTRLAPAKEDKKELVLDTGDKPLPEEIKLWIDSPGGLNMRSEPNTESEIIKIIPNGTELVALELSGEWYKISYDGKTGWVNKEYVRTFKEGEVPEKETDWLSYKNNTYGYGISYPKDWVTKDYGANEAAKLLSYVGFGLQLSNTIDSASLPPIVIKVTSDSKSVVEASYKSKMDSNLEEVDISGIKGSKYTYTASSGVQMTAYIVTKGVRTYILEESGGYSDEMAKMLKEFRLN